MEGCEGKRDVWQGRKERERRPRLSTNKQRSLAYAFVPNPHDGRVKNTLNATQTAIMCDPAGTEESKKTSSSSGKRKKTSERSFVLQFWIV